MATERTVLVRLKAEVSDFVRDMSLAGAAVRGLSKDIDTSNDRTAWLVQGFLALAPALIPLGAAATPILSGIVTQMTIGAAAAGVLALGLVGIGKALTAVNAYQLDPTAATLEKMRTEIDKLGPDGAEFVLFLDSIGGKLKELQLTARAGMLPGFTEGIQDALTILPQFDRIVRQIALGLGQLGREAGAGISGPGFEDFFNFLETDARPILLDMGRTLGNFIEGLANMIVAFAPMSKSFSSGFLNMSRDFAAWSHGLEDNQGFQDFVAYVDESVPKALDFLGSLGNAFLQVVEAASAVGDVLLPVFSSFFDIIGLIANSPIGSVFIGLVASAAILGRTMAIASLALGGLTKGVLGLAAAYGIQSASLFNVVSATDRATMSSAQLAAAQRANMSATVGGLARMGALAAGIALISTGAADSIGMQNTAMGATIGLIAGWQGALAGAAIGALLDFKAANDAAQKAIDGLNSAMENGSGPTVLTEKLAEANKQIDDFAAKMSTSTGESFLDSITLGITAIPDQLANANEAFTGTQDELESTKAAAEDMLGSFQDLATLMGAPGGAQTGTFLDKLGLSGPDLATTQKYAERLAPAMDALGVSMTDFQNMSATQKVDFGSQLREWFDAADNAAGRTAAVKDALAGLEGVELDTAAATDALKSSLDALFGVEIDQQQAVDDWFASLHDLKQQLKDTNGDIFGQSEALRENRSKINDSVEALLTRAEADARVTGSGKKLAETLLQGREAIIASGVAAGASQKDMARYLNTLKLTPRRIETIINTPGLLTAHQRFIALTALYKTTPKKVSTLIAAVGAAKTEGQVDRLLKKYGLTKREFKALLSARDDASPKVKKAQAALTKFDRSKANPVVDAVITNAMAKFGVVIKKADDVDKKHPKPKVTADTATASTMLQGIINKIAGIHDKDVTITVTHTDILNRIVNKVDPYHSAAGNFFAAENQYAAGGMDIPDGHRPEFASPGSTRIWREPETQGESYIPHADDWRRPNALSVLEQTANLFGLTVQRRFAEGGVAWAQEARKAMRYADGGYVQASRMNTGGYTSRSSGSEMVGRAVVELRTPWGTQEVDVLMRGVSREEYDADRGFERVRAGA